MSATTSARLRPADHGLGVVEHLVHRHADGGVVAQHHLAHVRMLRQKADTVIVVPNDKLLLVADRGTSMLDALRLADDVLRQGVQGICDLVTVPGLINLDLADVRTIMTGAGTAHMGIGRSRGDGRAQKAAEMAINSSLLETSIDGARGILLNISGGNDLSLHEVNEVAEIINSAADPEANIIFGAVVDETLGDTLWVTVVAAGFDATTEEPRHRRGRCWPGRTRRTPVRPPAARAGGRLRPRPRGRLPSAAIISREDAIEATRGIADAAPARRHGWRRRGPRGAVLPEVGRNGGDAAARHGRQARAAAGSQTAAPPLRSRSK